MVGGPIHRHRCLHHVPTDRLLTLFGDRAIPTGIEFGTVTVKGRGKHYEVTTLRTESLYRDGRRPEHVEWGLSLRKI